jgi:hypothetical protein
MISIIAYLLKVSKSINFIAIFFKKYLRIINNSKLIRQKLSSECNYIDLMY